MGPLLDAWRLAVGTLTAVPVAPPRTVDARTAGRAMLLAPLAAAPLALVVAGIGLVGPEVGLTPLVTAVLAIAGLVAGSRALHLDGLADTADGLTASYDRRRSLEVMKSGAAGPAGVAAVVLVLLLQVTALTSVLRQDHGWLVAGVLVCLSRCSLALACTRGVPGARPDGLGATYVGSVRPLATVSIWLGSALVAALLAGLPGLLAVLAAAAAVVLLLRRAVTRFGGVTGDVFGAAVELSLAALLVVASA
ncbi:adenosylcobinamide-GDP ribazoletransferase [Nocardioides sp. zg-579]|uniref:Adenosylcobinamide-GDP ribazoletransferase n=1 Tax=Nocardioides marmotae TaxID=2663857 RepID=A0A6I3JEL9_9ACTN|nr:adenosylcobinamide-GDP ribazoletransferase [Nocardioides marmotae]MCR6032798.1 adenosylcobinamide-GDP ribazoletransferase [Gordonia jinghuaiqii]MTB96448.1 adenosylcobinamide-GDP ribazoletransferase [Nocardioides marmotae]QKE02027.1 adenosylcobinamide-GDP ribazoletransferase [Nocardioides marmotae]